MKIAVIQLNATSDKNRNVEKAVDYVNKAATKKARFVLLPEVFAFRAKPEKDGYKSVAQKIPNKMLILFQLIAKSRKIFILAGSIYEKTKTHKIYNTSVLINPRGKIIAQYRKMHLFDANIGRKRIRESKYFSSGKTPTVTKVDHFKVGLSICYDIRFPEMYRHYYKKGAEILCLPSSFTQKTGQAHWETLLRARAIENHCYVLAPNQTGLNAEGVMCYGNSMVVDPWGKILARASTKKEEIIFAEIHKDTILKTKKIFGEIK